MEIKGLNVLVTGGAGFIGSHLVDELLRKECRVLVYDNFDPFYRDKEHNLEHHSKNSNLKLVRGDILDYDSLTNAMNDVDVVFHLAAQPGVQYSIKNPRKVQEVNVTGTVNVLSAALANRVKKTVYASSSSVYGVSKYLPFDEKHPTNPTSPYAASKLATEMFCRVFHDVYGLNVVMLRYFSVYGPRQRPDQVINIFVNKVLTGNAVEFYGDGEQTRDFTYVDDVVRATVRAAEVEEANGIAINIGSGRRISINNLLKEIKRLTGKEEIAIMKRAIVLGDFPHTLADIGLARKLLDYRPRVDLEKGLVNTIKWYRGR
jgi:UDP-glucose 4-epimerase